jgi:hypothetical protein
MTGLLLSACVALPTNDQVAAPTDSDFGAVTPAVTVDLFENDAEVKDVSTPTTFKPTLEFAIDALTPGAEPGVSINIYQTKNELELSFTETIIEKAGFHFDKLKPGLVIGGGKMEVGTPPKLTLDVAVSVTSTDNASTALLAVKGTSLIASVYIADIRIKQVPGGLVISSIGNATRANDKNDVHQTEVSARVIQTLSPGYVVLPAAGPMRTRTRLVSEPDPKNREQAIKVYRKDYTIQ